MRSVRNAIGALGYRVVDVKSPKDIVKAKRLVRRPPPLRPFALRFTSVPLRLAG